MKFTKIIVLSLLIVTASCHRKIAPDGDGAMGNTERKEKESEGKTEARMKKILHFIPHQLIWVQNLKSHWKWEKLYLLQNAQSVMKQKLRVLLQKTNGQIF